MAAVYQTTFSNAFFLNENVWILIKVSLRFVPKGPISNNPALVQIMAFKKAIIWSNDGTFTDAYMGHSASMSKTTDSVRNL